MRLADREGQDPYGAHSPQDPSRPSGPTGNIGPHVPPPPTGPAGTPGPPYGQQPYGQQPYDQQPYGQQPYGAVNPWDTFGQPPPNYLVWAILTTLFCCLPLGIVSIVFAAQVGSKWSAGDYYGAHEASRRAKQFAVWSAAAVGILVALYFALAILGYAVG